MGKFENGIWVAVQFLVCSHNETELAKQLVEESGLTMKDCLKAWPYGETRATGQLGKRCDPEARTIGAEVCSPSTVSLC